MEGLTPAPAVDTAGPVATAARPPLLENRWNPRVFLAVTIGLGLTESASAAGANRCSARQYPGRARSSAGPSTSTTAG
jgi:hypothetical protein